MNVCRHRGHKLVEEAKPNRSDKIPYPYHHWWYGLVGALRSTPYQDKATSKSAPAITGA